MAYPTPIKTWNIRSSMPIAIAATAPESNRRYVAEWKASMMSVGSTHIEVVGSCDSTAASMDGTDRWADYTDVIQAVNSGAHSWIVLRFPAIGTNFQLCIDMLGTDGNNNTNAVIISPSVGFSGGSTTARPTASDEYIAEATNSSQFLGGYWATVGGTQAHRCYVWGSTDGKFFYWARLVASNVWVFGFLGVPLNTPAAWTGSPWVYGLYGLNTGGACNRANWHNALATKTRIGSTTVTMYMTGEGLGSGGTLISTNQWYPGNAPAGWPMCPIGLFCTQASYRGRAGDMPDLMWGAESAVAVGDTFYDAGMGGRFWIQLNSLILPWDDTNPIVAN